MAGKTIEVLYKQTIYDIATQEYGSVEGVTNIMQDNVGVDLETNLFAGQLLKINGIPKNKVVAEYFKDNNLHPVSSNSNAASGSGGDFNNDFNNDFN